jgi:hypothetical protein
MRQTTPILATALFIVPLLSPQAAAQSRAELDEASPSIADYKN